MKVYSARLVEGTKNSYNIEFRHPILKDNNGKQGRKIRRGLGTEKQLAESIVDSINEVLKDNTLWGLSEKEYVEKKYGEKVADIFYDKMVEQTSEESEGIRENLIELPRNEEYSVAMFIGGTGVGKTSDIRVILGLDDNESSFPAISPTRTTTCNSEYIFTENSSDDSECVVTFLNNNQVINLIQESINNGVKRIILEKGSNNEADLNGLKKKIAADFMSHQENRFRLNYILGQYFESEEKLERRIEAYKKQNLEDSFIDLRLNNEKINTILDNIILLYKQIENLGSSEDEEVEKLDNMANSKEYKIIVDIILDHIKKTINLINDRYNEIGEFKMVREWPVYWYGKSDKLDQLIKVLEYIGGNSSQFFGTLLTPLVDGIRLKAPFASEFGNKEMPKLVIIDSEGSGHSGKKITSLPLSITNKFNNVDAIVIVDKADEAMKGISQVILNEVSSRGSQEKAIMLYNRFENIEGTNLFDDDDKKDFIFEIQNNSIKQMKEEFQLNDSIIDGLIKRLEKNTFFLKEVNQSNKLSETKNEFQKIIDKIVSLGENKKHKIKDIPKYEMDKIIITNMKAKELFNNQWESYLGIKISSGFSRQHWSRIKALSNRFANWSGYLWYDNLTPASDMSSYLMTQIGEFLHNPKSWKHENNTNSEDKEKIINLIQQKVSMQINGLIQQRIKLDEYEQWVKAYSHRDKGSTLDRRDDIKRIFDNVMPDVTLSYSVKNQEFILKIKEIIEISIKEIEEMYTEL
ncbi:MULTISPECIES: hypothetical protein [unclassified Clostridium]|uniref:hypothetical protein n=1 Tax=unclassified Clostridium TaxID=2614128 RepID=UPI00207A2DE2|nr:MULTISPECIES: hypothetical protein [unclassified Clostridium]